VLKQPSTDDNRITDILETSLY